MQEHLKTEKEKLTLRENSITQMHKDEKIKSDHLKDANKIVNNAHEIWEEISFEFFITRYKRNIWDLKWNLQIIIVPKDDWLQGIQLWWDGGRGSPISKKSSPSKVSPPPQSTGKKTLNRRTFLQELMIHDHESLQ